MKKAEIEQIGSSGSSIPQVLRYSLLGDPMLRIDPGPPLMRLEADWGRGFEPIGSGGLKARGGTNDVSLRLTVSDVLAVGNPSLLVHGEDWTDSLQVLRLKDHDKTYPRAYLAQMKYTIDPADESLLWTVSSTEGKEVGRFELLIPTTMRFFYNDYLEILPGVECPSTGRFKVTVDFPAYLQSPPVLYLDGELQDDIRLSVPSAEDSLHWEASFERTFAPGRRVLTVVSGRFSKDFVFMVAGDKLEIRSFNFPNPFSRETNIVYTLNLDADSGKLEIYNVSGVVVRTMTLGSRDLNAASYIAPHSIVWDGRDDSGDRVANGTYIYMLNFERKGERVDFKGKIVKLE